jgi:hypothetical protein
MPANDHVGWHEIAVEISAESRLFRARSEEQLAEPADRGVLVLHQLGHVSVRLEDGAHERGVLLVERLLGAAEDFLQSVAVHFDKLQRVSHPATTD